MIEADEDAIAVGAGGVEARAERVGEVVGGGEDERGAGSGSVESEGEGGD